MSIRDLRFQALQPASTSLRFGALADADIRYLALGLSGTIPDQVRGNISARPVLPLRIDGTIASADSGNLSLALDNAVNRAPDCRLTSPWSVLDAVSSDLDSPWIIPAAPAPALQISLSLGLAQAAQYTAPWLSLSPLPSALSALIEQTAPMPEQFSSPWQGLDRRNEDLAVYWHLGADLAADIDDGWRQMSRERRPALHSVWRQGCDLIRLLAAPYGRAVAVPRWLVARWRLGRSPAVGKSDLPPIPPIVLPPGRDGKLRFHDRLPASRHLRFSGQDDHQTSHIIPILRTYIVLNQVSLIRVADGLELRPTALSLAIDSDSWCWGWNATLPGTDLAAVLPENPDEPLEFEATVNGVVWRLLAEQFPRSDQFGKSRVTVSGRGIAALLADPYVPAIGRSNSQDATAQQCLSAALQINGVPFGWDLDWQLTDWLIPAGVWTHTGSYMDAATRIASAAGGYVQAHRTAQVLSILPRYPVAPWEWGGVTPDFVLPRSATTKTGLEFITRPDYNRIYISGEGAGILGRVTRSGTAGDLAAPMVTETLATHVDVARQRGLSVLGESGRHQRLSLETPVFIGTGLYPVGSFVQFADGAIPRRGLVRSVSVNAVFPMVRQTIEVECHD